MHVFSMTALTKGLNVTLSDRRVIITETGLQFECSLERSMNIFRITKKRDLVLKLIPAVSLLRDLKPLSTFFIHVQ